MCEAKSVVFYTTQNYHRTFSAEKPIANLPHNNVNSNENLLPSAIMLADSYFYCSGKIDIMLGAEHFAEMIKGGRLKINNILPSRVRTWMVG